MCVSLVCFDFRSGVCLLGLFACVLIPSMLVLACCCRLCVSLGVLFARCRFVVLFDRLGVCRLGLFARFFLCVDVCFVVCPACAVVRVLCSPVLFVCFACVFVRLLVALVLLFVR